MLVLLISERGWPVILIGGIKLVGQRLSTIDRLCWARLVLRLKFVSFPGVRSRGRIIIRIVHHRLLKIKLGTAKAAKVSFARIKFSAVLARVHIGTKNILRSFTNNSKERFVFRSKMHHRVRTGSDSDWVLIRQTLFIVRSSKNQVI